MSEMQVVSRSVETLDWLKIRNADKKVIYNLIYLNVSSLQWRLAIAAKSRWILENSWYQFLSDLNIRWSNEATKLYNGKPGGWEVSLKEFRFPKLLQVSFSIYVVLTMG